jgi:hypothetical protein
MGCALALTSIFELLPVTQAHAKSHKFLGTAMQIQTSAETGSTSTSCSLLQSFHENVNSGAATDTTNLFDVKCTGETVISNGGILVDAGGASITAGGLLVKNGGHKVPPPYPPHISSPSPLSLPCCYFFVTAIMTCEFMFV